MSAKVHVLPTGDEREAHPAVKTKRERRRITCQHRRLVVDQEIELVECEDCGERLGPMAALRILSVDYDRQAAAVEELERLRVELEASVEELRREERNAKARARRRRQAA